MTRYDDIEAGITLPADVVNPALQHITDQDDARGDWASPRDARQPAPPWPDRDSPMLRMLLAQARASIAAGTDTDSAMLQLAVHAWFEGGIEGYDRGQRDARRPRLVE